MNSKTLKYRQANLSLRARTIRDLRTIWPALNPADLDKTFPDWVQMAAAIVGRDRNEAHSIAADYLTAFSEVLEILPMPLIEPAQFATSMRVTSTVAAKRSLLNGKTVEQAMASAFVQNVGAATRMVVDAGRQTVMDSAIATPTCLGWRRVGVGRCDFCRMLIGRGAVYSKATVSFRSHDHCMCSAEPVFEHMAESSPLAPQTAEPPVIENRDVAHLKDDELEAEVARMMEAGDFSSPRLDAIAAELDSRDQVRQKYGDQIARDEWERLQASERGAHIWRKPRGQSAAAQERAQRDEYETWLEIQFLAAEEVTRGNMLSHDGQVAGIRPRDLFDRSRRSLKWASPELQEWFAANPRMSFSEFRAGSSGDDPAKAARRRSADRGWESEFG